MSEADLIVDRRPAHLPAVAVGDPEIGPEVAKEILNHFLGAQGRGDEKGAVVVVEDPQPPVSLADPQAGLVGLQDRSVEKPGADRGGRRRAAFSRASWSRRDPSSAAVPAACGRAPECGFSRRRKGRWRAPADPVFAPIAEVIYLY